MTYGPGWTPPALISWIYGFERGTERQPPAPSRWAGSDTQPRGARFLHGSWLSKHRAGSSSVCSSAAPRCLCPQETSPLPATNCPSDAQAEIVFHLHQCICAGWLARSRAWQGCPGEGMRMPGRKDGDTQGEGTSPSTPAGTGGGDRQLQERVKPTV